MNKIMSSALGQGTMNLIKDVTSFLTVLGPVVAVCFIIYYIIRRISADEHETTRYNHKMVVAAICGVGVGLVSGMLALLTSYYGA